MLSVSRVGGCQGWIWGKREVDDAIKEPEFALVSRMGAVGTCENFIILRQKLILRKQMSQPARG